MSMKSILREKCVHKCEKDTPVAAIVKMMKDEDVGSIVVVEKERPVGIITDRDLVLRGMSKGSKVFKQTAADLMTQPVETISEDCGLQEAIEHMNDRKIRRLCITDKQGRCVNVISAGDIMELWALEIGKLASATVPCEEKLVKHRAA